MAMKIDRDPSRFQQIVRGKIRENLRKYVTHGEMIGRKGRDLVSIPVPQLDVPHFRYGKNGSGGVGPGRWRRRHSPSASGGERGDGSGPAGSDPGGAHPGSRCLARRAGRRSWATNWNFRGSSPKAKQRSRRRKPSYNSIRRTGPESLRHFKRTYMQALKRQISANSVRPDEPRVVPIRDDKRYRSWDTSRRIPQANAAMIYMMDVSGSMTDEQKEIVRTDAFWIDTWLCKPIQRRRDALHHSRRRGERSRRSTRSITPAKAAARGSVRPTKCAPN